MTDVTDVLDGVRNHYRATGLTELRTSGLPPSPGLGVVIGPDFAQLSANLGRNLMEGRLGILTAVFEAA
jgi:hypothetical protein